MLIDEAQRWVNYLNGLWKNDRVAMANLVALRVHCNTTLAAHPTCQVMDSEIGTVVGLVGIINGFLGVDKDGNGPIWIKYDDHCFLGFGINKYFEFDED